MTVPTGVRERPILMHARSVRGILADLKTQTRRVLRPQPPAECTIHYMLGAESWIDREKQSPLRHTWEAWGGPLFESRPKGHLCGHHDVRCPFGQPGDRLWVREAWALPDPTDRRTICYRASGDPITTGARWRPSIHMPRWASRLTLEVTEVRVQRVQDITDADAQAEGCTPPPGYTYTDGSECYRDTFRNRWDELNAARGFGWAVNPWVWALTFRVVEGQ